MASVRERGGRYTGLYRTETGQQRSAGTFPTRKAALRAAQCRELGLPAPVILSRPARAGSVREYAGEWLAGHRLEPTSRETYGVILAKHVLPEFGQREIAKITQADVRSWFRKLESTRKSGALLAKIRTVANAMFATALADGLITRNPVEGLRTIPETSRQMRILTTGEYGRLITAAPERYRLMIRTMAETGLRWGEVIELRPEDLTGTMLSVRRVAQELSVPLRFEVKPYTKNGKTRVIKISAGLAGELVKAGEPGRLLFTRPDGSRISHDCFYESVWKPALRKAGISEFRVHDLRHTAISWWLHNGMPLESARDRAGHSSLAVTSRYVHARADAEDAALAALESSMTDAA
jgi:integrase